MMLLQFSKSIFFLVGITSFVLGFIGIFLPLLPTTPFMILSATCFAKSSERFHAWLLSLPGIGEGIQDWNEKRIISRKAKRQATFLMLGSFMASCVLFRLPLYLLVLIFVIMLSVLFFLWFQAE